MTCIKAGFVVLPDGTEYVEIAGNVSAGVNSIRMCGEVVMWLVVEKSGQKQKRNTRQAQKLVRAQHIQLFIE